MPIDQPGSANLNPSSFTRIDTVRRSIRGGEQLAWGASVFIEGSVGIGIGLRGIGIDCGAIQRWYVNGDGAHLVSPTRGCKVGGFGANNEGNGAVSMTVNPLKLLELVTKGVAAGSRNTVDSASLNKRLEQAAIAAKSAGQFASFSAQIGISASNLMFVRLNIGANALEILKGIPQARPILEVLTKVSSVKSGMGLQVTETDFGGRENFENALKVIGMGPAVSTLYQMRQQRA